MYYVCMRTLKIEHMYRSILNSYNTHFLNLTFINRISVRFYKIDNVIRKHTYFSFSGLTTKRGEGGKPPEPLRRKKKKNSII